MKKAKRLFLIVLIGCFLFALAACGTQGEINLPPNGQEAADGGGNTMTDIIYLTIGGHSIAVKLENNSAAEALIGLLRAGDITYTASDYGGFEKVGELGHTLPRSDTQMTTEAGDVILYAGDQIVLFYGSNSWSYTRLGKMQLSAEEVRTILTEADPVSVTIGLQK